MIYSKNPEQPSGFTSVIYNKLTNYIKYIIVKKAKICTINHIKLNRQRFIYELLNRSVLIKGNS